MKKFLLAVVVLLPFATLHAADQPFYVYTEAGSRLNHYIPSGWMGDFGDLHMSQRYEQNPGHGKTSMQVKYTAERKQGAGWAGIYWQTPANNWGDKKSKGYDLHAYKKLVFLARGEKGGEYVDKFLLGGIDGAESSDSDSSQTDSIELTKEWKQYEIDLSKLNLATIIGGFGFVINADMNPKGATIYIDEVRYE